MRKIGMRGIDRSHEQDPRMLLRDTRTLGQMFVDFLSNPTSVSIVLVCCAIACVMMPAACDLIFLVALGCFAFSYTRKLSLPYRMPKRSEMKDYNDMKPGGSITPNKARGIALFGNDRDTNEELWFNNDDMRTHVLIFGSTGSGKTEALISIAYNALIQASGFIYVDGKGDNTLFSKVFSMARSMGREDDVLVINFMTGARDIIGPQLKRLSNTLNPFSIGSSSMLAQLVVSMMDASAATPDGDMWKGRAISFVEALMKVLVYARDQEMILLDANTIRNYFELSRIESIVIDKALPRDEEEPASLENAPDVVLQPVRNYLKNLPGYDKAKKGKQGSQTLEQHGFITMQLTRAFTSLADTYGHILRTQLPEVDVKDVVLNRRILVVLLPALEKSPEELSNLGKIIVSSLKAMMASGLGEDVEGDYRDVIQRKPTNAPTPFVCILDEYGYYAVPGFAVVPAQARSLGFSAIFAGQDLPAFQKASKEEALSIGANTNIKICMKLEDPLETWDFFMKTAGEAYVTKVDHFQTRAESFTNTYLDTRSASFEKRARVDLLDLKEQREGEAHIFFKSTIVRAKMFYADPKPVQVMRLNQFIKVSSPRSREVTALIKRFKKFEKMLSKNVYYENAAPVNEDISVVASTLAENEFIDPIEKGVSALIATANRDKPQKVESVPEEEVLPDDELNIFTKLRASEEEKATFLTDDIEGFSQPILMLRETQRNVQILERVSGKSEQHAENIAEEIIKDMRSATMYPPDIVDQMPSHQLTSRVIELNRLIQNARDAKSSAET